MTDKLVGCFRRPQLDTDIHSHLTRMLGQKQRSGGGRSLIKHKIRGVSCISLLRADCTGVHFLPVRIDTSSFEHIVPLYWPFPFSLSRPVDRSWSRCNSKHDQRDIPGKIRLDDLSRENSSCSFFTFALFLFSFFFPRMKSGTVKIRMHFIASTQFLSTTVEYSVSSARFCLSSLFFLKYRSFLLFNFSREEITTV